MFQRRFWIIFFAVVWSLLSIFLFTLAAYDLSWIRAKQFEQYRLSEITGRLIERIRLTYTEAEDYLFYLNKQQNLKPCSEEQIKLMRHLTFNSPVIDEIDYIANGYQSCGTWGKYQPVMTKFTDEITSQNGIKISLDMRSSINQNRRMISLRYGNYHALINPIQFSNVILEPNTKVMLLDNKGNLIASSNNPDLGFIRNYLFDQKKSQSDQYFISVTRSKNFIAIATEPKLYLYNTFIKQLYFLIPLGIFLSLPLIALIIFISKHRLSIKGELIYALNHNKLSVYYQPIIDLANNTCIGAEALIRWFVSKNESIPSTFFISIAEQSGIISKITRYVIDTVTKDMKSLLLTNRNMLISINVSSDDFKNSETISFLESKLVETNINRNQICFEITERQLPKFDTIAAKIEKGRTVGYKFAIDDFGTGYSNLSYLKNIRLDVLKIDTSFIDTIGTDSVTSDITKHIINIAKQLNLKIVAEGVETKNQLDYLQKYNVEYAQGWLFSKALNRDDFLTYYHNNKSIPD